MDASITRRGAARAEVSLLTGSLAGCSEVRQAFRPARLLTYLYFLLCCTYHTVRMEYVFFFASFFPSFGTSDLQDMVFASSCAQYSLRHILA